MKTSDAVRAELRRIIIQRLCEAGRPLTSDELFEGIGDKREARKILGELVRNALVLRQPDHARRRMVFKPQERLCDAQPRGNT